MRVRWLIAAALIAALFTLQSLRRIGSGPFGVDGSYYMQVARHVAQGEGLVTSVDLYHQGLRTLPTRTNIYPLWPLLLGFAAKAIGLTAAATYVPRMLFMIALIVGYALIVRLAPPTTVANFDYGHLAIALLGLNTAFLSTTCYPYTEGLGIALTLCALLLCDVALKRRAWTWYALTGVAASLAFLTRSQMLIVGPAIGLVLLIALRRHISRIADLAAFVAGYAVPLLLWIAYLTTFVRPFDLRALIAMHSETPGIPPYDQHAVTHGTMSYVADRLSGLAVMFNPLSDLSFVHSFGPAALLVPVAAIYYIARRRRLRPISLSVIAVVLCGTLMSLLLLEAHNRFFLEWLFGYRHGLPFVFVLVPSAILLLHSGGGVLRTLAIVLIALSIVAGARDSFAFATATPPEWPAPAEKQFASWIEAHDPNAIVLTTNAQTLSIASNANFRWSACDQSPDSTRGLLTLVRTDYVLLYEPELDCPLARGLQDVLQPAATFGVAPNRILLLENRMRSARR